MKKTEIKLEYRVSPRVLLEPGDVFHAKGGPLWRLADGTRVSIGAKGPFRFHRHCLRWSCEWIEAADKQGCTAVLHLSGRRKRVDPSLIPRPYVVTRRKRRVDNSGSILDKATKRGRRS